MENKVEDWIYLLKNKINVDKIILNITREDDLISRRTYYSDDLELPLTNQFTSTELDSEVESLIIYPCEKAVIFIEG